MSPRETAERYYEVVDEGDYERLVELFSPDARYERPGQDVIEGREALLEFYETGRPLSNGSHRLHELVADGDTVAVRGTFEGEQDGGFVSFGFADFHVFDDEGRIAVRYTYTDRDTV